MKYGPINRFLDALAKRKIQKEPLHEDPNVKKFPILKVSKFQNEFMKSLFLQKYEPEILTIFGSFINSF